MKQDKIDIRSLLRNDLNQEEKRLADKAIMMLDEHQKLLEILQFDPDDFRERFESFVIDTENDKLLVLEEAKRLNSARLLLDTEYCTEETLIELKRTLWFLYNKFECVREIYFWWDEWFNPNNDA